MAQVTQEYVMSHPAEPVGRAGAAGGRSPRRRPAGLRPTRPSQRHAGLLGAGLGGASLTDLTGATGITRTSMYAAFGYKEDLYRKALGATAGPASYVARALKKPTAREVATAFLNGAVEVSTRPDCPAGCLGVQGSLASGETGRPARDLLADWREGGVAQLRDRFGQAVDDGDLPPGTDPLHIARYLMTFANGIAVQATGGATREDLRRVADTALSNWPPA
ncbi:hypothetical protein SVIOM342S_00542 [Streptomyces violaceorubidus]